MDLASILSAANQLSSDDRLRLVEAIWDGLDDQGPLPPLTDAHRRELERRLREHEANPDDVVSWEEVKTRLLSRLSPS